MQCPDFLYVVSEHCATFPIPLHACCRAFCICQLGREGIWKPSVCQISPGQLLTYSTQDGELHSILNPLDPKPYLQCVDCSVSNVVSTKLCCQLLMQLVTPTCQRPHRAAIIPIQSKETTRFTCQGEKSYHKRTRAHENARVDLERGTTPSDYVCQHQPQAVVVLHGHVKRWFHWSGVL